MFKRYPIRVLKYFLFLAVLFAVLFGVMLIFKWTSVDTLRAVWGSNRVWLLAVIFIGFPLVYPFFSYVSKDVRASFTEKRDVIERVLAMSGFTITEDTPERIIAHTKGIRKVSLMFEDRIEITPEGNHFIKIEGHKREVVKIERRLRAFVNL